MLPSTDMPVRINSLLDQPALIKNGQDVNDLAGKLNELDIESKFTRPDTKWALASITNVEFYVTPQKSFVAGCKDFNISHCLKHCSVALMTMIQDSNRNKFNDNLCFFRCLAQCKTGSFEDKDFVFKSFVKYCNKKGVSSCVEAFQGVPYTDIELLENLFEVDIKIYQITGKKNNAVCFKNSIRRFKDLLNLDISLNLPDRLTIVLLDLDQYAKRYQCLMCTRLLRHSKKLSEHAKKHCNKGVTININFPAEFFKLKRLFSSTWTN